MAIVTHIYDRSSAGANQFPRSGGLVLPRDLGVKDGRGYTDLHFNGLKVPSLGIDCNFMDCPSDKQILALRKYLFKTGTKTFLPTLVTGAPEHIEAALKRIQDHLSKHPSSAEESAVAGLAYIPGVHIEGGYIDRLGSHDKKYAQALGPEVAAKILKDFPGLVKIWTISPSVDKDFKMLDLLRQNAVIVSLGHSHANYDQGLDAIERVAETGGKVTATHWANGMSVFANGKVKLFERNFPAQRDLDLLDTPLDTKISDLSDKRFKEVDQNKKLKDYAGLGMALLHHPEAKPMLIIGSEEDKDQHIGHALAAKVVRTKDGLILSSDAVNKRVSSGGESESGASKVYGYEMQGGFVPIAGHVRNALDEAGLDEGTVAQIAIEEPAGLLEKAAKLD